MTDATKKREFPARAPWIALLAVPLVLATGAAQATIVGYAVSGDGSSTTVGSTSPDGSIIFYALLNGSGTFGAGAGTSADTCTEPGTCTGGTLDMFLRFDGVSAGANVLSLFFTDLDLLGVHDPSFFRESLVVTGGTNTSGGVLGNISAVGDVGVVAFPR